MRARSLLTPLVLAAGVCALAAIYHLDPASTDVILCPYRLLTGWACPGCGLTRAMHYVLHADLSTAFAYNPLAFVAMPLVVGFAAAPRLLQGDEAIRWRTVLGWLALGATLAFWLWRNTPAYPFLRL